MSKTPAKTPLDVSIGKVTSLLILVIHEEDLEVNEYRRSGISVRPSPLCLLLQTLIIHVLATFPRLQHTQASYNPRLPQVVRILMQAFLRRVFCLPKKPASSRRSSSTSYRMSSSATAASIYAATISPASVTGAEPEEAKDKRHHLKHGKGFTNPWVCTEPPTAGHQLR